MPDDELIDRLEALGAASPGPLGDGRRSEIERRVVDAPPTTTISPRRPVVMSIAAAVLVILVAGLALFASRDGPARLEAASGDVRIELPDGRTVDAAPGTDLPDGTLIDIAGDASARVDGIPLGPGRYTMRDGRPIDLPADAPTTTAVDRDDRPEVTDGPAVTDAPTVGDERSDRVDRRDRAPGTTTTSPLTTATDRPAVTDPPARDAPTTSTASRRDRRDAATTTAPPTRDGTTTSTATTSTTAPDRDRRDG